MLLLFSVTIWGDEIYFRSLGVKDGLSQPSSIAIWQDRLGRIWLGNNAVNCYDGVSTKVIRLSEYFPSLEDANIHNFCGNDSTLYLLAENNLICIDLQMRQPFMPEITATAICYSDNQLYTVEGHSLYRCNVRSGEKEILFSDERYRCIESRSDGKADYNHLFSGREHNYSVPGLGISFVAVG